MPSHRAARPYASTTVSTSAGRRRASTPRRRPSHRLSTIVGAALLVAAAGAVVVGNLGAPAHQAASAASEGSGVYGDYISYLSAASLAAREAPVASRSGSRPGLASNPDSTDPRSPGRPGAADRPSLDAAGPTRPGDAARRQVAIRNETLRTASSDAQSFAKTLRRERLATKSAAPDQRPSDAWVLPTSGFHITVWFGEAGPYWSSGYHTGIDFATAYGTPVVAVADATVAQAGWDGAYGNQVRLQLENGDQVWYNHLSAIEVGVADTVARGQELGRIGETGNAYGAHLHFEYRLASDLTTAVDPLGFFEQHGIHLS